MSIKRNALVTTLFAVAFFILITIVSTTGISSSSSRAGTYLHAALPVQPNIEILEGQSSQEGAPGTRKFAWKLFEAFFNNGNGDMDWGDWNTWESKATLCLDGMTCQISPAELAHDKSSCPSSNDALGDQFSTVIQSSLEFPNQLTQILSPERHLLTDQTTKGLPFSTVLFNRSAALSIRKEMLDNAATLKTMKSNGRLSIDPIPGVNPVSKSHPIVIKAQWELLSGSSNPHIQTAYVWDSDHPVAPRSGNQMIGPPSLWTTSYLNVDLDKRSNCGIENIDLAQYPGPAPIGSGQGNGIVPIGCFKFIKVTCANLTIARNLYPQNSPKPGDFLILVGVHVMKKIDKDWVWSTMWWTNHPKPKLGTATNDYNADRPSGLNGRWKHYVMKTTMSPSEPAFNPYIEGGTANTMGLNCITCHKRAGYPHVQAGQSLGSRDINGNVLNPVTKAEDDAYFKDSVTTDFLWSLVSRYQQ